MKKALLASLLALSLMMPTGMVPAALAEAPRPYRPEEIDLSGVQEVNGRLVGEVHLPKISKLPLRIDCPVPMAFTMEQSQRLTVEYRKITKNEFQKTLAGLSIAADPKKGSFSDFLDHPERYVWYQQGDIGHVASFSIPCKSSAAYFISGDPGAPELSAAKEAAAQIVASLGGASHMPLLTAEKYGEHLAWPFTTTDSTASEKTKALALKAFRENREKYGLMGEDIYVVYGLYDLLGLPVMGQARYLSGGDWYGFTQDFSGVFRADGSLLAFQVNCLPVVKEAEPLALPSRSWQELLALWISQCYSPYSQDEDLTYADPIFGEVTTYATYATLTELNPCWITLERFRMEPGWNAVIEVRVVKDDSLVYPWTYSTDAMTLTKGEY